MLYRHEYEIVTVLRASSTLLYTKLVFTIEHCRVVTGTTHALWLRCRLQTICHLSGAYIDSYRTCFPCPNIILAENLFIYLFILPNITWMRQNSDQDESLNENVTHEFVTVSAKWILLWSRIPIKSHAVGVPWFPYHPLQKYVQLTF